jgi:hypothetical protein
MEDYVNLYQQHILNVKTFLLKAKYYRNHRAEWEDDRSNDCILMAEENLAAAKRVLKFIKE